MRIVKNSRIPFVSFLLLFIFTEITAARENSGAVTSVADLAVSNFSFLPDIFYAGTHPNNVSFRITNNGPSDLASPNTQVGVIFYLSRNSSYGDADDIQIGLNSKDYILPSLSRIDVTLSSAELSNITIPASASGDYYVFVRVQHNSPSTLTDTTPGNNYVVRVGTITVINLATDADLALFNFTFSPQTMNAGAHPVDVSFRLANNGPVELISPDTRVDGVFYLSRNSTYGDADDIQIGIDDNDFTLKPSSYIDVTLSATDRSKITIPANAIGSYYVFIRVQHSSPSKLTDPTSHNDYAMRAGTITVVNTNADLATSDFTFLPQTINAGANPDSVSFRLTNNGPADLSSPNTLIARTYYLSRNNVYGDADDIQIGNNSYDFTLISGSYTSIVLSAAERSQITIPSGASGSYYVFVRVQHNSPSILTDPTPGNNYSMRLGTITVVNPSYRADLAASNFTFLPQTINAGANPEAVSFSLTNNGPSGLYPPNFRVESVFYLSRNSTYGDADDIQIGINGNDYTLPSLSSSDVTLSATERSNIAIPANASGSYYLFVRVQHFTPSVLTDPTPGNDFAMRVGTITVVNTGYQADLAPFSFTFSPQTINAGANPDAASFNLNNYGSSNLSSPNTRITGTYYLSRNNAYGDADDIQIGNNSYDFTLLSGSYTSIVLSAAERSQIIIPFSASGSYYVFVRVQHNSPSILTDPAPGNNYTMRLGTITVANPIYQADLSASNFTFSPQAINAGANPEAVSFSLTNNGPSGLYPPNSRVESVFYLSPNSTFGDADDIQIGTNINDYTLPSLSNNEVTLSAAERSNITIPANVSGSYYLFVRVQHFTPSVLTDPTPGNDYAMRVGTITVVNTKSDLSVSDFTFSPQTIIAGTNPDAVLFRLTNNGPMGLSSPNTRVNGVFYLSLNGTHGDADDIQIGNFGNDYTLPSLSYNDVTFSAADRSNITIPAGLSGYYYVFVRIQHGTPSVLTDPTPGNDYAMRVGTIRVIPPCSLSVLPASLSYSSSPDGKVINITSNSDWTVTDNADWISVSSVSGSNNGTLTVTVTQNTSTSRTGKILVAGCDKSISIDVQQDGITTQTIKKIQGEANISPYVGTYQRISGTVTGVIPGVGYFIQDAAAAWSGIYVADTHNFVLEGNGLTVDGTVQEINGVTTINAALVQLTNPPSISPILLGSPEAAKSEQYESVLVKVKGARFQGSQNPDGSWEIKTTETNRVIINKLMFEYKPVNGHFYDVTGIVNGTNNYKIEPRKVSDIIDLTIVSQTVTFENPDIMVYPNPFTDYLNISNSDKLTRLIITNMTGQVELDIMYPQPVIKTANLVSGIYIIRLYTDSGLIMTRKFVRK